MKIPFLLALAVGLLSGCASLSREDCVRFNWHLKGKNEALRGEEPSRFGEYREMCAKHGIEADVIAFNRGRAEGLQQFCTRENGYKFARAGNTYEGICPKSAMEDFLKGYRKG